jgi:hypothetical protein
MRNDGVIGEGGVAGVESRWLEEASEDERQGYRRAKGESSSADRSQAESARLTTCLDMLDKS